MVSWALEGEHPAPYNSQENTVFISYASEDFQQADRLYKDLKHAGLNPWLDKHNLLPGKNWEDEIENAIGQSRYFIPLFSKTSVEKIGYVQSEFKFALEVLKRYPPNKIFYIPVRLDDCEIPYKELDSIYRADLFPVDNDNVWKEGVNQILRAIGIASETHKDDFKTTRFVSPIVVPTQTTKAMQKLVSSLFKGEKEFFVGRREYLSRIIKKAIKPPASRVAIVGPGGSGKSQLAFKAIHQYEKEGIFDVVIPLYFVSGLKPLSQFLSNMADNIGIPVNEFHSIANLEDRKSIVRNVLSGKSHPLIFVDNYETVSYELNDKSKEPSQSAIDITNFLNDNTPNNTSILLTSRERNNGLRETVIELEGLSQKESKDLFNGLIVADKLLRNPKNKKVKEQIQNLLKKTGGHPLSIELIAKNITSVEELEELSEGLGTAQVDRAASEERFKSLEASFGYTLNKLDNALREILPKLTIFKSPFPISAAVEIYAAQRLDIINLYNRSLLTRIESENPDYLLYYIHPALRTYLQNISDKNLEFEYGEAFSEYYWRFLSYTYNEWGKENHLPSIARFNIIAESEYSGFDRAIELTKNNYRAADIATYLGLIFDNLGILSKALAYHRLSLGIDEELSDRVRMSKDYMNIGIVLYNMGKLQEALDSHNKALKIDEELNRYESIGAGYSNIGIVLNNMGKLQEALDSHNKALNIREGLNDKVGVGRDYKNIGNVLENMGKLQEALDSHNKALKIHEELNNRVWMAADYYNISLVLSKTSKDEALESLYNALTILQEFERENNYHHPLTDAVNKWISYLGG